MFREKGITLSEKTHFFVCLFDRTVRKEYTAKVRSQTTDEILFSYAIISLITRENV